MGHFISDVQEMFLVRNLKVIWRQDRDEINKDTFLFQ